MAHSADMNAWSAWVIQARRKPGQEHRHHRAIFVTLVCLSLTTCSESLPPEKKAKTLMDVDAELLRDLARAGPEVERGLQRWVRGGDALIFVRHPLIGKVIFYFFPATSPWVISCGVGLSVTFGTAVSGD